MLFLGYCMLIYSICRGRLTQFAWCLQANTGCPRCVVFITETRVFFYLNFKKSVESKNRTITLVDLLVFQLPGIAKMFSSEMTLASAWIHLLAVDLFAARFLSLSLSKRCTKNWCENGFMLKQAGLLWWTARERRNPTFGFSVPSVLPCRNSYSFHYESCEQQQQWGNRAWNSLSNFHRYSYIE